MEFETPRLRVKDWRGASLEALADLFEPEVTRDLPPSFGDVLNPTGFLEALEEQAVVRGVWLGEDLIGLVILFVQAQSAHLGYFFAQSAWGQGIGSELILHLVGQVESLGINTLYAGVHNGNAASEKVLTKAAFFEIPTDMPESKLFQFNVTT